MAALRTAAPSRPWGWACPARPGAVSGGWDSASFVCVFYPFFVCFCFNIKKKSEFSTALGSVFAWKPVLALGIRPYPSEHLTKLNVHFPGTSAASGPRAFLFFSPIPVTFKLFCDLSSGR